MKILEEKIERGELLKCENLIDAIEGLMVKGAVDVIRGILGVDADLHADIERALLENGSEQDDVWGINLYPEKEGDEMVEFDSMINIRPRMGNRTRHVEDADTRAKIIEVVRKWVQ